jgi:hypothetical protein
MAKVRVTQHIAGDLEAVFALISDHETFLSRFPGMRVRIVTSGSPERNGLGCIREVLVGKKIRYLEAHIPQVRSCDEVFLLSVKTLAL